MRRRCTALAVSACVALTVTACTSPSGTPRSTPAAAVDLGVEHVHGLGTDPADGTLYAATHFGLFRLPERGEAERVADRFQDTMGFTVVGPATFLGSGHPDFQMDPDLPTRLGLIRSEDAGESWEIISLGDRVDFHVLHAVHDTIYGWDASSGGVMVSADDGRTWETRSTLDLRDFVVDPAAPGTLLATTPQGVVRSGDDGRTWQPVPGAPAMAVLAWPSDGALYGVTAEGTVQSSADGGVTWTARGTVGGEPEALFVDNRTGGEGAIYVAVSPGSILVSTDGGTTFSVRYRE